MEKLKSELKKLSSRVDVSLPDSVLAGCVNGRFMALEIFLERVNAKLEPPKKDSVKEKKQSETQPHE